MNRSQKIPMTEGSLVRHTLRLCLPTFFGLLGIFLFNIADIYFVGQLGTEELAALSFVFPIIYGYITLSIALGIAATTKIAHALGAGNLQEAREITRSTLIISVLYGILLSLLGWLTTEPLFSTMGAEPKTLHLIQQYIHIWYASAPLLTMLIVGNHVMRAYGVSMFPGIVMTAVSLLNIALDPIMIFGLFGMPRMEVAGAAWATLICRGLGAALICYGLWYYTILGVWRGSIKAFLKDFRSIASVALPASGQNIVQPAVEWFMVFILASFGASAVATYGVITRVYALILLPYYALSMSLIPLVAQNWGAAYRARVDALGKFAVRFALIWGACCTIPLFLFAEQIALLFDNDPQFVAWTTFYFQYIPWSFAFAGLVMLLGAFFYGVAKPFYAFITEVIHWIILYTPLAYIASRIVGVEGLLLSETLANVCAALLTFTAYRWVRKRGF